MDTRSFGTTRQVQPYGHTGSPTAKGAYVYRSNSKGKCERRGVQSVLQASSLKEANGYPTALPMISRGFCLRGRQESRYKRSGSVAKCDDPRVALGPAVLSESAAL